MSVAALRRDPWIRLGTALLGVLLGLIAARLPLAATILILATVGLVLIITRADLVLLAMIAALPWENKLHYPSASLSTVKAIGAAVMLAYLLRLFGNRRTTIHLPPLFGIVTGLGIWIGVTFVVSHDPSEGTQKLIRWALFFAFFFLVVQLVDGRREIRRALRWFTGSVAAAAVYALSLFIGAHNGYRAAGPLEDPNDFAYLLACTIPIVAYLVTADRRRRLAWSACFVIIVAAMLATFSRGALVGIGALLLWGILTRRIPLWALTSGIVIALVVTALAFTLWKPLLDVALHEKTHIAQNNIESREQLWGVALKLAERRPLTGVGPAHFSREALPLLRNDTASLAKINISKLITHNTYLEILSENGIPALLLFIAYLATAWRLLRRVQRRAERDGDTDERRLATALQASFIIAIVSATFLSEELTAPFWLLGGLAVVLARAGARASAQPAMEPTHGATLAISAPST
jgi:putative inorganic carbon (HCO3(-)) transporter